MQALIQTFEIETADAWTLFKLLDTDGSGSVDIAEFIDGCIRLRGGAKSIHIAQIMYHHKWMMDKLVDVYEELRPLNRVLNNQKVMISLLEGGFHHESEESTDATDAEVETPENVSSVDSP